MSWQDYFNYPDQSTLCLIDLVTFDSRLLTFHLSTEATELRDGAAKMWSSWFIRI